MGVCGRLVGEARVRLLWAGSSQRADDRRDQRPLRRAERAAERSDGQTRREFSHVGRAMKWARSGYDTKRRARRPEMRVTSLRLALQATILATVLSAATCVD